MIPSGLILTTDTATDIDMVLHLITTDMVTTAPGDGILASGLDGITGVMPTGHITLTADIIQDTTILITGTEMWPTTRVGEIRIPTTEGIAEAINPELREYRDIPTPEIFVLQEALLMTAHTEPVLQG